MSVDFDAIARAGRCDVSSLRLALPLLEQGYTPPFLARYRRDELSGVDEAALWALSNAIKADRQIAARRDALKSAWELTSLRDPAIGRAIEKATSSRVLARLVSRLKSETSDAVDDATRLATRVLNPIKGDGCDFVEIASKVNDIQDATSAVAALDDAIVKRLIGDPRIIAAATRWLAKNARIHIESISDPHGGGHESGIGRKESRAKSREQKVKKEESQKEVPENLSQPSADVPSADVPSADLPSADLPSADLPSSDLPSADLPSADLPSADLPSADLPSATVAQPADVPAAKTPKKPKKVSPRQRRRRWLVGVLKPLSGKRFKSDKLSAFQIVMLGRALRSQVAKCSFEYDATKLVAEIQKSAVSLNRHIETRLIELVLRHEADIREAAESAWWDDLAQRASARLVNVIANHLRRHVNRGGVDAKIVMSIDAVGPRTAAAAIVSADGRVLHCEDIPCQLSATLRSQAVTKMGELIHNHHIDLIVISNGPARRATMIALGDLIKQSPERSIRWTLADRSGADAYSGSAIADQEMRSTPRRFRAAAWLAFSIMQPAQAITKVDPLKLRLSSFQRELSDDAVLDALDDVLISGASRGGVDANSAPVSWLARLPGMTPAIAEAIDQARRESLFTSRNAIVELDQWESTAQSRQAIPFLRVFGSNEVLDGTLVHPEDYSLAQKLAAALEIELPPALPPGYQLPEFDPQSEPPAPVQLTEVELSPAPIEVEDFSSASEEPPEFAVAKTESPSDSVASVGVADSQSTQLDSSEPAESNPPVGSDAPVEPNASGESSTSAESPTAAESNPPATDIPEPIKRPLPENSRIDKCIKEWQIGSNRADQIVHWLCDPFGDSDVSGTPPAVLSHMPTTKELKTGDRVIGVVVSVMPFGVFVELAPDCSGLIHVSRVSESFVEDLHEAVQVGDVVTAWVIGIDEKRRRVGLSAVSPERAKQLDEQRRLRDNRGRPGGNRRDRPKSPRAGTSTGSQEKTGGPRGTRSSTPRDSSGKSHGKSSDQRRGKEQQGGRSRGGARGGRDRGGRGRQRKPESFRVESKKNVKPISEEMQKGSEPMRTFGDLAQFFGTGAATDKVDADSKKPITKEASLDTTPETKPEPDLSSTPQPEANSEMPETDQRPNPAPSDPAQSDNAATDTPAS